MLQLLLIVIPFFQQWAGHGFMEAAVDYARPMYLKFQWIKDGDAKSGLLNLPFLVIIIVEPFYVFN